MSILRINPRNIVFDEQRPLDEGLREAISKEGLYDDPKGPLDTREMIAVRQEGELFRAIKGADKVRAVLDLLDKNTLCNDPANGRQEVPASELYQTIRVMVSDS